MGIQSNPFIGPFLKRIEHRYSRDFLDMTYAQWVSENTTHTGKPFSFARYPFQVEIMNDMHANMDVKKCSQVGLTEVQIRKSLAFLLRNRGTRLIFTLPNEPLMDKVSQSRIKPLVEKDQVFNAESDTKAVRSKSMMQFGDSFLYVTGCSEADATSTSADAVFNDEVDLSPQDKLALFNSRLQDSDWKINQRFSTPTFPSFGIDLSYESTDQREYRVKCDRCNHWNAPEFTRKFCVIPGLPDNIEDLTEIEESIRDQLDAYEAYVQCEKCHNRLDLADPEKRRWIAKYPSRSYARGYHVTPFSTARLPIHYLIDQLSKYKRRDFIRGFHNTVLGQPFDGGDIRLTVAQIEACMRGPATPEYGALKQMQLGIDVGQTCHLTMGPEDDIVLFEAVPIDKLLPRIKELMSKANIVAGCIDRQPYEPTADEVFRETGGKIVPVEYRGTAELAIVKDKFERVSHATVNRTMHLDHAAGRIRRGALNLHGYGHYKQTVIDHLRDMVRNEEPEKPAVWEKLNGNDHFFHSIGYHQAALQVAQLVREVNKDEIRTEVLVKTPTMARGNFALTNNYLDRDSLTPHRSKRIVRRH